MIKNRLILTRIFIEMGVIEIEYELNKINVFTKSDEDPVCPGFSEIYLKKFKSQFSSQALAFFVLINQAIYFSI
jgi:hypothetical protein